MPVYVIAQGQIENREMLTEYVGKAIPTIQASGGRVLGFDESPEVVEGRIRTEDDMIELLKDADGAQVGVMPLVPSRQRLSCTHCFRKHSDTGARGGQESSSHFSGSASGA